jgi:hypothetical protein
MNPGDLRRWNTRSNGDVDTPFLLVSIEGLDATVMHEGEIFLISKAAVWDFSEPMEEPNDQG